MAPEMACLANEWLSTQSGLREVTRYIYSVGNKERPLREDAWRVVVHYETSAPN
jgi:hypothetical protein